MSFQAKLFLAALVTAALSLAVGGLLFATTMRRQIDNRIQQTLVAEAQQLSDPHVELIHARPAHLVRRQEVHRDVGRAARQRTSRG